MGLGQPGLLQAGMNAYIFPLSKSIQSLRLSQHPVAVSSASWWMHRTGQFRNWIFHKLRLLSGECRVWECIICAREVTLIWREQSAVQKGLNSSLLSITPPPTINLSGPVGWSNATKGFSPFSDTHLGGFYRTSRAGFKLTLSCTVAEYVRAQGRKGGPKCWQIVPAIDF